jgi:hypothetical protein
MASEIPLATPYPWDNEDMVHANKRTNEALCKGRKCVGSGFVALFQMAFGGEGTHAAQPVSDPAKTILVNLLQQHNVPIPSSSFGSGNVSGAAMDQENDDDEEEDEETEESDEGDESDGGGPGLPVAKKRRTKKKSMATVDILGKYGSRLDTASSRPKNKRIIDLPAASLLEENTTMSSTPTANDDEVLRQARSGSWSLFLSLLKVMEEESKRQGVSGGVIAPTTTSTPTANKKNEDSDNDEGNKTIPSGSSHDAAIPSNAVTTKHLIRSCALTLSPGDVPGALDAKEMVMAALYFLSSRWEPRRVGKSSFARFPSLPLIRLVEAVGDLEKRSYIPQYEWWKVVSSPSTFTQQVLRLEQVFLTSQSSWKFVPRIKFSPPLSLSGLSPNEEAVFFLKGSIPASVTGKKKGEATRKRKSSVGSATVTTGPRAKTTGKIAKTTTTTTATTKSIALAPMALSMGKTANFASASAAAAMAGDAGDEDDEDDDENEDDDEDDDEDEEEDDEEGGHDHDPLASSRMMMSLEDANDGGSDVVEATVLMDNEDDDDEEESSSAASSSPSHSM